MATLSLTPGRASSPFVGVQRDRVILAPGAGAEAAITLPGGSWWRLLYGRARFVTSAAVANRAPALALIDSDGAEWQRWGVGAAIAASLTTIINFASGGPDTSAGLVGGVLNVGTADILIPGGWSLRTVTSAIDAADQYDQIRFMFEELDLGPLGGPYGLLDFDANPATGSGAT